MDTPNSEYFASALVCTRLSLKPDLACKQVLVLFLLWSLRLSSYLSSLLIKCFVYFELRLFVSFASSYGSPLSWNGSRAGDVEQSICLRIVCRFSKSSGRSAGRELPVFAQFWWDGPWVGSNFCKLLKIAEFVSDRRGGFSGVAVCENSRIFISLCLSMGSNKSDFYAKNTGYKLRLFVDSGETVKMQHLIHENRILYFQSV